MTDKEIEYLESNKQIPFCTHKDVMHLKKTDIEALGIITHEAHKTNYDIINEIGGFDVNSEVNDNNLYSFKKVNKEDINIGEIGKVFGMSGRTISRHLKSLEDIHLGDSEELVNVIKDDNGIVYEINHKAYDKYYILIDRRTLRMLLKINGTALKLYLVIKYNYENCMRNGKPCILDYKYLASSIGLSSNGLKNIADILNIMEGTFIKRYLSYNSSGSIVKKIYEYEIIETFNEKMIKKKD